MAQNHHNPEVYPSPDLRGEKSVESESAEGSELLQTEEAMYQDERQGICDECRADRHEFCRTLCDDHDIKIPHFAKREQDPSRAMKKIEDSYHGRRGRMERVWQEKITAVEQSWRGQTRAMEQAWEEKTAETEAALQAFIAETETTIKQIESLIAAPQTTPAVRAQLEQIKAERERDIIQMKEMIRKNREEGGEILPKLYQEKLTLTASEKKRKIHATLKFFVIEGIDHLSLPSVIYEFGKIQKGIENDMPTLKDKVMAASEYMSEETVTQLLTHINEAQKNLEKDIERAILVFTALKQTDEKIHEDPSITQEKAQNIFEEYLGAALTKNGIEEDANQIIENFALNDIVQTALTSFCIHAEEYEHISPLQAQKSCSQQALETTTRVTTVIAVDKTGLIADPQELSEALRKTQSPEEQKTILKTILQKVETTGNKEQIAAIKATILQHQFSTEVGQDLQTYHAISNTIAVGRLQGQSTDEIDQAITETLQTLNPTLLTLYEEYKNANQAWQEIKKASSPVLLISLGITAAPEDNAVIPPEVAQQLEIMRISYEEDAIEENDDSIVIPSLYQNTEFNLIFDKKTHEMRIFKPGDKNPLVAPIENTHQIPQAYIESYLMFIFHRQKEHPDEQLTDYIDSSELFTFFNRLFRNLTSGKNLELQKGQYRNVMGNVMWLLAVTPNQNLAIQTLSVNAERNQVSMLKILKQPEQEFRKKIEEWGENPVEGFLQEM